jgi:aspartate ammonia-lyase
MPDNSNKILDALIAKQIIGQDKAEDIKKQAKEQGKDLGVFLVENKIASEEQITEVRAQLAGLPYFSLLEKDVPEAILNFLTE